jgi:hypothetical protein
LFIALAGDTPMADTYFRHLIELETAQDLTWLAEP